MGGPVVASSSSTKHVPSGSGPALASSAISQTAVAPPPEPTPEPVVEITVPENRASDAAHGQPPPHNQTRALSRNASVHSPTDGVQLASTRAAEGDQAPEVTSTAPANEPAQDVLHKKADDKKSKEHNEGYKKDKGDEKKSKHKIDKSQDKSASRSMSKTSRKIPSSRSRSRADKKGKKNKAGRHDDKEKKGKKITSRGRSREDKQIK